MTVLQTISHELRHGFNVRNGSKADISANVWNGWKAHISRIRHVPESFRGAYRSAMSTKHIDTAANLVRLGASVKIECGSCGASRTLSGAEMVAAGAGRLAGCERRLKCSKVRC